MKTQSIGYRFLVLIACIWLQAPSAEAATILVKLKTVGTLPVGELVGGWGATLLLPASGVTIKTDSGGKQISSTSFSASGTTPASFTLSGSYFAPNAQYSVPSITLLSLGDTSDPLKGSQPGEVATIVLETVSGAPVLTKSDFSLVDTVIAKAAVGAPLAVGLTFDFDITTATDPPPIQTYTITANVTGGNGTVSCTSPVNSGASSTCTVTPASGYQVASFTDNSVDKTGAVAGGSYSIANVTADHTVVATFSQIPVTPVNGACGSSDKGTFASAPTTGFCTTGTATAVTGSGPWGWTCSGSNGGTSATCSASIQTYTITANVTGGNGTVSCTSPVNSGASSTCTVSPASGYQVASFTDNNVDKTGAVAGGSYSIANVTADHTVVATFSQIPVTPVNGACGSSDKGTFASAPTTGFCTTGTATAVTGSGPWGWTCSGSNGGTSSACSASIQTYTITANVTGGNGTVSCTSPVNSGASSTCTVTPASGYQVASFTDNSVDKTGAVAGGSYSIANVTADHTVVATFSQIPVTPVNGACGSSDKGTFASAPTTGFCTTGTATAVTGSGPWGWTCSGSGGGTNAACSAALLAVLGKPGDCDTNGTVTIAEVQSAINMFLGLKTVAACVDTSADKSVSIAEVQKTINSFLGL